MNEFHLAIEFYVLLDIMVYLKISLMRWFGCKHFTMLPSALLLPEIVKLSKLSHFILTKWIKFPLVLCAPSKCVSMLTLLLLYLLKSNGLKAHLVTLYLLLRICALPKFERKVVWNYPFNRNVSPLAVCLPRVTCVHALAPETSKKSRVSFKMANLKV